MAIRAWQPTEMQGSILQLPSGGTVEITDDEPVKMGDGFTYSLLTYRNRNCEIVFEVRNATPWCVSIKLTSGDDRPLRPKDLADIRLADIRSEVYAVAGVGAFDPNGEDYDLTPSEARKAVDRASSRRRLTPEFLVQVAEVHQGAPEGGRTDAVKAAFDINDRKAYRWIAAARKGGLVK